MNPVHTRLALLVSLLSLGWSSVSAANETPIPGPLAPPEPSRPFGVANWPENWSFELADATRSAHGDIRLAAPEEAAHRPVGRFETGPAPASFQDYSIEGQHYVCLDGDSGLLARAATGCRVPPVLSNGALAAAEASALFFGATDKARSSRDSSATRTRAASGERAAESPPEGSQDQLKSADDSASIAPRQHRPGKRKQAARTEATSPAATIAKSTIRADLSGFHDECPFSLPGAVELAEASSRAIGAEASKSKPRSERSAATAKTAKAAKTAKQPAAGPIEQVGKAKASKAPARTAAARTPATARNVTRPVEAADPIGPLADTDEATRTRPYDEGFDDELTRTSATTSPDGRTVLSEAVRAATQALADLRFVHEEDPFLVLDGTDAAEPKIQGVIARAEAIQDASAHSVEPDQPAVPSADRPAVEGLGARVESVHVQRPPASLAGPIVFEAESAAALDELILPALSGAYPFWLPGDMVVTAPGVRTETERPTVTTRADVARRSVIEAAPIEVYGVLADEYAAAAPHEEAGPAVMAAEPTVGPTQDEMAESPRAPSPLDSATVEVYGLLADEYAESETRDAAVAEAQPQDDRPSAQRVVVDESAGIGRATVDLLTALEQWVAQVAKAEPVAHDSAAWPMPAERPAEGIFAKGSVALAEAALDGVRGGFDDGNGLRITFGIERAVYINGNLVATTNFNVADLGKVTGGQAAPVGVDKSNVGLLLIQNGPGNVVQPGIAQTTAGTVIQNTLNNQNINSVTLVNASVNSLQMFKGIDLQSMLRNVVTGTVQR
jgi:hypothetical protein